MDFVYQNCPVFETKNFILRLVALKDAKDLLCCYNDKKAFPLFNSDNCTSNFSYSTVEEMENCIQSWLREYSQKHYVRFALQDKQTNQAVGTFEIFNRGSLGKYNNVGILRLDICYEYETDAFLQELFSAASRYFYAVFDLEHILTKAVSVADVRRKVLLESGYEPFGVKGFPYSDYFIQNMK